MRLLTLIAVVCAAYAAKHDLAKGEYTIETTYGCHDDESEYKDVCGLYANQASLFSKVGLGKDSYTWHVAPKSDKDDYYQIYRFDSSKRKRGWSFTHSFSMIYTQLVYKTYFKLVKGTDGYVLELTDNCNQKGSYRWPCEKPVDFTSSHYLGVGDGKRKVMFKFNKV